NLTDANLTGANLSGANLTGANLSRVNGLETANLSGVIGYSPKA
ncbi:MAG: pentapeptide repeat-containing protein, partial [Chloroflexi bacterium]|nr:pentapeptide repeat-containing protein [Chloroflexota bacterium]